MNRDEADFIADILQSARLAQSFIAGMDFGHFQVDEKTIFAVVRALEVLGEATKRISHQVRIRYPEVPWRAMAGIRDRLIHGYENVNLEIVWKAVIEDLPLLIPQLEQILSELLDAGKSGSEQS